MYRYDFFFMDDMSTKMDTPCVNLYGWTGWAQGKGTAGAPVVRIARPKDVSAKSRVWSAIRLSSCVYLWELDDFFSNSTYESVSHFFPNFDSILK